MCCFRGAVVTCSKEATLATSPDSWINFQNFLITLESVVFPPAVLMLAARRRVLNALGYKWTENWYNT